MPPREAQGIRGLKYRVYVGGANVPRICVDGLGGYRSQVSAVALWLVLWVLETILSADQAWSALLSHARPHGFGYAGTQWICCHCSSQSLRRAPTICVR